MYSCQILFLACAAITPDFITFSTQERDFRRICLHLRKKSLTENVTDFFVVIDTNQHQDKKDPHWRKFCQIIVTYFTFFARCSLRFDLV